MHALVGLVAMVTATWALLMAEVYVVFEVIRPLGPNIHESMSSEVLKVGTVIALFALWAVAMYTFQRLQMRAGLKEQGSGSLTRQS